MSIETFDYILMNIQPELEKVFQQNLKVFQKSLCSFLAAKTTKLVCSVHYPPRLPLDSVARTVLIHAFLPLFRSPAAPQVARAVRSVHFAGRRCAWLDKYIAMRLFQSLDASPFAPREYSHGRMSRGQAVTASSR